ncbi:hypothetical protein NM688_g5552 [Phlebia brevispora]|uniref:Uncharacterized protein n=1 Tax=Phlebia brevispora TaxID=194682 RepID=A0ACC1STR2_9APHY|nr:hypothetical protein NM688_g5552 [Phlebia brevispora]
MLSVCDKLHKIYSFSFEPVVWARSVGVEVLNELDTLKAALVLSAGSERTKRDSREVGSELAAKGIETFARSIDNARTISEALANMAGASLKYVFKQAADAGRLVLRIFNTTQSKGFKASHNGVLSSLQRLRETTIPIEARFNFPSSKVTISSTRTSRPQSEQLVKSNIHLHDISILFNEYAHPKSYLPAHTAIPLGATALVVLPLDDSNLQTFCAVGWSFQYSRRSGTQGHKYDQAVALVIEANRLKPMSVPTPDSVIIATYQANLISNFAVSAVLTVVCYEFLITIQYEYDFVWHRKWSAGTWLFLANRYLILAFMIITASPVSPQVRAFQRRPIEFYSCKLWLQVCYNSSLNTFIGVFIELPLFIMTVYALLDRAYVIAAFVFLLGLVPFAINLYQDSHTTHYYVDDPVLGSSCYVNYEMSASAEFYCKKLGNCNHVILTFPTATLAGVLSGMLADAIAVVATWLKTYRHVRKASSLGANVHFGAMFLQYGSMYFVVMCATNLASLLVLLVVGTGGIDVNTPLILRSLSKPSWQSSNPLNIFLTPLPSIVISRFLINLRQVDPSDAGDTVTAGSTVHFTEPTSHGQTFSSWIGNLGEPLSGSGETLEEERANIEVHAEGSANVLSDVGICEETSGVIEINNGEMEVEGGST